MADGNNNSSKPGAAAVAHAASMTRIVNVKAFLGGSSSDSAGPGERSAGTARSAFLPEEIGSDFSPSMADSFSTTLAKAREALLKPYDASDRGSSLLALAARTVGILAAPFSAIAAGSFLSTK